LGLAQHPRREVPRSRSLSEILHKERQLAVVGDVGAESLVASGVLLRALRTLGVDFEFYTTVDPVSPDTLGAQVVGVGAYVQNCSTCVELAELRSRKPSQHVAPAVVESLKDVVTVAPEEYALLISSALTRYTPRSLFEGPSQELTELVVEAVEVGAIREVTAPKLLGWGLLPLEEVVRYSVDLCLPRYFGRAVDRVSEQDVARELGVESLRSIEGRTYVPTRDIGVLDLYEAAYVLEYSIDVEGPEYTAFIPLNYSYLLWATRGFRRSLGYVRSCLDAFLERRYEKLERLYILECNPRASATVVAKVLRGLKLVEADALVAFRVSGSYYLPLQLLQRQQRVGLAGFRRERGYAVLDSEGLGRLLQRRSPQASQRTSP
jgi:hypothetical protein